jgi:Domain of unknown function (DUF5642)
MRSPSMLLALTSVVGVVLIGGCSGGGSSASSSSSAPPPKASVDIDKVLSVKSTFAPPYLVRTIGKTAIDPKLLVPIQFQQDLVWDPADCAKYAWTLPAGLKGNIATLTAEGEGNRFIAMAVETSEPVRLDPEVVEKCKHVTFSGKDMRGVVDVVDAPQIDGVQTLGKHRQLQTATASGELYTYVAYLGDYLVVVTANPVPVPNQPVPTVNVERAQQLLTDAVAAVRG